VVIGDRGIVPEFLRIGLGRVVPVLENGGGGWCDGDWNSGKVTSGSGGGGGGNFELWGVLKDANLYTRLPAVLSLSLQSGTSESDKSMCEGLTTLLRSKVGVSIFGCFGVENVCLPGSGGESSWKTSSSNSHMDGFRALLYGGAGLPILASLELTPLVAGLGGKLPAPSCS